MLSGNWFGKKRLFNGKPVRTLAKGRRRKEAARGRALRVEELEDRRMLATYIVNNLGDLDNAGNVVVGSLRQAIAQSNSTPNTDDTIVFADYLFAEQANGATSAIQIDGRPNGGQYEITDQVEILGPGPKSLSIIGAPTQRIFDINIDADNEVRAVTIGGVTLTGGSLVGTDDSDDNRGGAIRNREGLTLVETVIAGNSASQGGGGIFSPIGSVTVERSLIANNSAGGGGGGIFGGTPDGEQQPTVTINNSTITGNQTFSVGADPIRRGYGAGVLNRNGRLNVNNSTITQNNGELGNGVASWGNPPPDDVVIPDLGIDNDSFEDPIAIEEGLPFEFLKWSGDEAVIVPETVVTVTDPVTFGTSDVTVTPLDGANMLQFVATTPASTPGPRGADDTSEVWQLIDAAVLEDLITATDLTFEIELKYFANRVDEGLDAAGGQFTETEFVAEIQAHMGDPATFDPREMVGGMPNPNLLVASDSSIMSDPDSTTWEEVTATISGLPEEVTFLAIKIGAREDISPAATDEFVGHFADDVSLKVTVTSPIDIPDPTVFTTLTHSIVFGNGYTDITALAPDEIHDVDVVGMTDDDPPKQLLLSIESAGYNFVGGGNVTLGDPPGAPPVTTPVLVFNQPGDMVGVDPLLTTGLVDAGGSTLVFYPTTGSPIVDAGDPSAFPFSFEQRGRHFTRVAGAGIDVGAVELQQGRFVVDSLDDENDQQYSPVYRMANIGGVNTIAIPGYEETGAAFPGEPVYYSGDFTLREAIEFAEKNPGPDVITFTPATLPDLLARLDDPTFSAAPTIELDLHTLTNSITNFDDHTAITITEPVFIVGPTSFELEIDAAGNDSTPGIPDSGGTRVFSLNDYDVTTATEISISNLTILGGDVVNQGGGILNNENLTLNNVTIKDNAASTDGGGIFTRTGNLTVENSAIVGNRSGNAGGGLFVDSKFVTNFTPITATVRNSTISGNTTGLDGAGLYNKNGEVLIEYSTITDNFSPFSAGVASYPGVDAFTRVRSSIIAGNLGDDVTLLPGATNVLSLGYNLIGDGNVSVIFTQFGDTYNVADPMLAPLALNGGFVPVHRLLPGSPAIDAGSPVATAGVGNVPLFDQRGNPYGRVFDGVQDNKDRIDIGAYEVQATTYIVDTLIDENDGNTSAGNFSLREAIEASNANPFVDTIMFDPLLISAGPATIFQTPKNDPGLLLKAGTPTDIRITDSVNIIGLGSSVLELNGSNGFVDSLDAFQPIPPDPLPQTRFFTIDDSDGSKRIDVHIRDLSFAKSVNNVGHGGAVLSVENLSLQGVAFVENSTFGDGLSGGAVYQSGGEFTLDGTRFASNSTEGVGANGGGVYVENADIDVINNTRFLGNNTFQTASGGGGLYATGSTIDVRQSAFSSNTTAAGNSQGAGLHVVDSTVAISDNTRLSANSTVGAQSRGSGLYAKNSNVTVTDATIVSNTTAGTFASGAGLFSSGGTLHVSDSDIAGNTTSGNGSGGAGLAGNGAEIHVLRTSVANGFTTGENAPGGAIHNLNGNLTILDSTVSGNTASGPNSAGGGITSDTNLSGSQKTLIINSTISGNTTGAMGGGVFNADGLTEIKYSTITNNNLTSATPYGFGSGVASYGNANTRTEVGSSIIAGNSSTDVDRVGGTFVNSFASLGYNVVGDGLAISEFTAAGDQTNVANILLGPLEDNGGPTRTHRPQDNSPVVNAGNPAARSGVGDVPVYDQRGLTPRVQGDSIDAGAVEYASVADFNSDGFVNGTDFLSWQRGYGTAGADKSDGDANNDNFVDGVDLSIWQSGYGDPTPVVAFAAAMSGGESDAQPETLVVSSEPSSSAVVLAASQSQAGSLAGLTLEAFAFNESTNVDLPLASENVEVSTVAKDHLFAVLSPLPTSSSFQSLGARNQAAGDDSEDSDLSAEDHVFELLGVEA